MAKNKGLVGKFKDKIKNYYYETGTARKVLGVLLITNLSSFVTTGMQKEANISDKNAAVVNSLNSVPVLYDIGYSIGHRIFYNDKNYIKTAEDAVKNKNKIPRPYLNWIQDKI